MTRFLALALALAPSLAGGTGDIYQSRHNLSASGPGSVKARSEARTCVFCHVAHSGKGAGENRPDSGVQHQGYRSSTLSSPTAPRSTGATRMCLSCHDGTVAVGRTLKFGDIPMRGAAAGRLQGKPNLGIDLSSSHPVSFRPRHAGRTRDPRPDEGVPLDRQGMVQCTSCHDPHVEDGDPQQKKFLVKQNRGATLCLSCHQLPYWQTNPSSHQQSLASPAPPGAAPEPYATIADNGCGNCHAMHNAGGQSLVRGERNQSDDAVCLRCHDGRVARLDVAAEVAKPFAHAAPPAGPSGHDASEGPASPSRPLPENRASQARHATCVDCHDPHASADRKAVAPRAPGSLAGVWGIDRNGMRVQPVNFEYEVCFKCHGDSANQPQRLGGSLAGRVPKRARPETNLRLVFDPSSAVSFHPVLGPGRNPRVPGLVAPLTSASVIYCSDCHSSDSPSSRAPRGPHGSSFEHLLAASYTTGGKAVESPSAYALCYRCHQRDKLLSGESSFSRAVPGGARESLHARHLLFPSAATSCSTCHNAHGVSALSGKPGENAHLIDFDRDVVGGAARYLSAGDGRGNCTLLCHGKDHVNLGY